MPIVRNEDPIEVLQASLAEFRRSGNQYPVRQIINNYTNRTRDQAENIMEIMREAATFYPELEELLRDAEAVFGRISSNPWRSDIIAPPVPKVTVTPILTHITDLLDKHLANPNWREVNEELADSFSNLRDINFRQLLQIRNMTELRALEHPQDRILRFCAIEAESALDRVRVKHPPSWQPSIRPFHGDESLEEVLIAGLTLYRRELTDYEEKLLRDFILGHEMNDDILMLRIVLWRYFLLNVRSGDTDPFLRILAMHAENLELRPPFSEVLIILVRDMFRYQIPPEDIQSIIIGNSWNRDELLEIRSVLWRQAADNPALMNLARAIDHIQPTRAPRHRDSYSSIRQVVYKIRSDAMESDWKARERYQEDMRQRDAAEALRKKVAKADQRLHQKKLLIKSQKQMIAERIKVTPWDVTHAEGVRQIPPRDQHLPMYNRISQLGLNDLWSKLDRYKREKNELKRYYPEKVPKSAEPVPSDSTWSFSVSELGEGGRMPPSVRVQRVTGPVSELDQVQMRTVTPTRIEFPDDDDDGQK
jgi:hypothetical protein